MTIENRGRSVASVTVLRHRGGSLGELDEDASAAARVEESDPPFARADANSRCDHFGPQLFGSLNGDLDFGHANAHVVHTGSGAPDEARDRRLGVRGLQ